MCYVIVCYQFYNEALIPFARKTGKTVFFGLIHWLYHWQRTLLPLVLKAVEATSQRKLWRASFSTILPEWKVTNFSNHQVNPNHDRGKSTLIRPRVGKYALLTLLVFLLLKSKEKLMLCYAYCISCNFWNISMYTIDLIGIFQKPI